MLSALPLTLVPLVLYNAVVFGLHAGRAGDAWRSVLVAATMPSGVPLTLSAGDGLVALGIVLLFVEILKATRTGNASLADHALSMAAFVAYLVEFLTVGAAADAVFALLTVLSLVDVVAGFSITIRGARRDVGWGG